MFYESGIHVVNFQPNWVPVVNAQGKSFGESVSRFDQTKILKKVEVIFKMLLYSYFDFSESATNYCLVTNGL